MDKKDFIPMARKKSLQEAIAEWEKENTPRTLNSEEWVDLIFKGIQELDSPSLNYIKNCTKLSLSSNFIIRIPDLHFDNLKILSLGRNKIKQLRGLDFLGKSLEQLWISYNEIEKLDPMKNLVNLQKLYIGNNMIKDINELNYLANLPLEDVVFKGNPFTLEDGNITKPVDKKAEEVFPEIKKRVPSVVMIDGILYVELIK